MESFGLQITHVFYPVAHGWWFGNARHVWRPLAGTRGTRIGVTVELLHSHVPQSSTNSIAAITLLHNRSAVFFFQFARSLSPLQMAVRVF